MRKIKTTNIILDSNIEDYLDKRLEALEKFVDSSNPTFLAEVELGRTTKHHQSGDIFRAEINITIDGNAFRAVSERPDLMTAIDDMKD